MIDRILAIIFFISTVVLTFLVIKRKTPTWARLTEKLIGQLRDTPPEFEVTYEGRPINDGYRTWIIFFNKGFETIRKADISEKLTVHFKKAEIIRLSGSHPAYAILLEVRRRLRALWMATDSTVLALDPP